MTWRFAAMVFGRSSERSRRSGGRADAGRGWCRPGLAGEETRPGHGRPYGFSLCVVWSFLFVLLWRGLLGGGAWCAGVLRSLPPVRGVWDFPGGVLGSAAGLRRAVQRRLASTGGGGSWAGGQLFGWRRTVWGGWWVGGAAAASACVLPWSRAVMARFFVVGVWVGGVFAGLCVGCVEWERGVRWLVVLFDCGCVWAVARLRCGAGGRVVWLGV